MTRLPVVLLAVLVVLLSACAGAAESADPTPTSDPFVTTTMGSGEADDAATLAGSVDIPVDPIDPQPVTTRSVAPSVVAEGASDEFGDHVVYLPENPLDDRLLVYLVGTNGKPRPGMAFLEEAAGQGITTIGLAYPNKGTVYSNCVVGDDPDCAELLRTERLSGEDVSPLDDVAPIDGAVPRLTALLTFLAEQQPDGPWAGFLGEEGEPNWPVISVAGHSQGSGMAAMLSKWYPVERAIVLAGVSDPDPTAFEGATREDPPMAPWLADPGETPGDRIYTFVHRDDGASSKVAGWNALGIEGDPILWSEIAGLDATDIATGVDGGTGGNMFISDRELADGERPHPDPLNGPYEQLWRYLLLT